MKEELESYFDRLWPLNRSLTGNGVRRSLEILNEIIDLNISEIPSGTQVFDWTIPKEWNVKEAYIETPDGERIADFSKNNLHLLGYSIPASLKMSLAELKPNLYTLKDQPNAIPYLTSYYKERWGFCISEHEFNNLKEGEYRIHIDAQLKDGALTYGDSLIEGKSKKEILFSTYICHPSLANNELSGPLVVAFLYKTLKQKSNLHFTYRFVFAPETIGAIAYLTKNGQKLKDNLHAGYVVTCAGDSGKFTFKKSRKDYSLTNELTLHILKHHAKDNYLIEEFSPTGSDERQYCSPQFNLPVGSLMRTMYGRYKEYHTSLDDKNFISFEALEDTIEMYLKMVDAYELNHYYFNTTGYGEPQLGKRNLYPDLGSKNQKTDALKKILYILNYSDGTYSLLEIAEKLECSILELKNEVKVLLDSGLLIKQKDGI